MNLLPAADPLTACQVDQKPLWFQAVTWIEIFVQLPFFFMAAYAFTFRKTWIRIPCIIYASCALTAFIPIMTELMLADNKPHLKAAMFGFYSPFLFVPMIIMARALLYPDMFGTRGSLGRQKWQ